MNPDPQKPPFLIGGTLLFLAFITFGLSNPFKSEAFCSDCGKPLDMNRWF